MRDRSAREQPSIAVLSSALEADRFRHLEPRVSIMKAHRPLAPLIAGGVADHAFLASAEVLARERAGRPTLASGLAYLIRGAPSQALSVLAKQVKPGTNASIWSDYAAAYLQSAAADDDPLQSIDALWASDEALAVNPHSEEALFNRALALRNLGLLTDARQMFLQSAKASRSEWKSEAELRARELKKNDRSDDWPRVSKILNGPAAATDDFVSRAVGAYHQQARTHAEAVWPAEWAEAYSRGDRAASAKLDLLRRVARQLRAATGEALADDAAAVIERLDQENRAASIADSYLTYREGRILYSKNNPTAAEKMFRKAERQFRGAGSPMQYVARYYIAGTLFEQSRFPEASAILDDLDSLGLERHGYRALEAQIGWERGVIAVQGGAYSDGFEIFARSRRIMVFLGELEFVASFDALVAGAHEFTGDPLRAWRVRREALRMLSTLGNRSRILVVLENAATAFAARGEWHRALALLRVTASSAEGAHNALGAAHAWTQLASLHARHDETVAARNALQRAREWIRAMPDERQRARAEADLAYAESVFWTESAPQSALDRIQKASAFFEAANDRVQIPRNRLQCARVQRRLRNWIAARRELDLGLAEIEAQRANIRDLQQRALMFSAADELFDEAIALAVLEGGDARALLLAERQRSRALLDGFSAPSRAATVRETQPLGVDEIRAALAPDAAIVEYVVAPEAIVIFVIRPGGVTRTTVRIPRSDVAASVDAFRRAAASGDAVKVSESVHALSGALLSPIRAHLAGARQVAFIPDRSLHALSFAMLMGNESEARQDAVLFQSPSATLAIECSQRARSRSGDSLLAVAGSVVDRQRYGDLPLLANVEDEAEAAARIRQGEVKLLMGEAATPSAVLRDIGRYRVVHVAAHALHSIPSPLDSRLLLAPEPDAPHGELRAGDIAAASLPHTRLVILAACRSAAANDRGDGVANLATAFIEAGVPTVVATLWDADDEPIAELMADFHRHMRGGDAAKALHAALRDRQPADRIEDQLRIGGAMVMGGTAAFVR